MPITTERPRTALYVLRAMKESVSRIVSRHEGRGTQVNVPGQRVLDAAQRYANSYDAVLRLDRSNAALKEDSSFHSSELATSAADWAVVFAYDITGSEPEDRKPTRTTDDEIIRAAQQMRTDIANAHAEKPIEGAEPALADLDAHIEAASQALAALKDGLAKEQELRSQTRQLGVEFSAKIVAYRRSLGRVIGRRHRDHRALFLTRRALDTDVDVDDSVEVPATDVADSAADESSDNGIGGPIVVEAPPVTDPAATDTAPVSA